MVNIKRNYQNMIVMEISLISDKLRVVKYI